MAQFLILYASRYGQTAKIADHMAHTIRLKGYAVNVVDLENNTPTNVQHYNGVLVGTPLYASRYDKKVVAWVRENLGLLRTLTSGFFLVSLNAADTRPEAVANDQKIVKKFSEITEWLPSLSASFAGALTYTRYNFLIRYIMKRISKSAGGPIDTSRDHELTDWKSVENFALQFLHNSLDKIPTVTSEPHERRL